MELHYLRNVSRAETKLHFPRAVYTERAKGQKKRGEEETKRNCVQHGEKKENEWSPTQHGSFFCRSSLRYYFFVFFSDRVSACTFA